MSLVVALVGGHVHFHLLGHHLLLHDGVGDDLRARGFARRLARRGGVADRGAVVARLLLLAQRHRFLLAATNALSLNARVHFLNDGPFT